ncbi:hypothetical protein WJX81_003285 [Elliptochloris bilobata]|uniref:Uncharacterized protein n=1 Tax=Elliptochloris bilobata TaxID=381761 RepID=A0AAW1RX04_9CHLO
MGFGARVAAGTVATLTAAAAAEFVRRGNRLKEEIRKGEEELRRLRRHLEEETAANQAQVAGLQEANAELDEAKQLLLEQRNGLYCAQAQRQAEHAQLEAVVGGLRAQLDELRREHEAQLQGLRVSVQDQAAASSAQIDKLQQQHAAREAALQGEVGALRALVAEQQRSGWRRQRRTPQRCAAAGCIARGRQQAARLSQHLGGRGGEAAP